MLSAQVESLSAALLANEIQPMLPDHWAELGMYRDRMPLDPDYPSYFEHDAAGRLAFVALRNDGLMVGYFVCFIAPTLHYRTTLTAKMDLIYIQPRHRGGGGKLLEQAMLAELKARGVKLLIVGSKDHHPIQAFWQGQGYEPMETHHSMWIGDDDA